MVDHNAVAQRSLPTLCLEKLRSALAPTPRSLRHPQVRAWFWATLAYAAIVAILVWDELTGDRYAIADDARQHVFWMLRFTDPALFPQDWIADYYQSVSPVGYIWLYRGLAALGISPLLACKLLPPLVILLTAGITFLTVLELSALPAAGFAAAAMLTQSVEYIGTVASGNSKAFVYGLALLFMYGWLRRSVALSWVAIALQGVFYPQGVLLTAGLLALGGVERRAGRWQLRSGRPFWILTGGGLLIAALVILYYGLSSSEFGPTMTAAIALTMPEFLPGGRTTFFNGDLADYFLAGRPGLRLDTATTPVTNLAGLALPFLRRWPQRWPLALAVGPDCDLLWKLALTALGWFVAAHAVLFTLYLPSRYTGRFLLLVLVLAGAIALVILMDGLLRGAIALLRTRSRPRQGGGLIAATTAIALGLLVVLYPLTMGSYPFTSVVRGGEPDLYQFFESQPKDSLIAGLSIETSNIPTFAGRSVLTSAEVAIPYHQGYYQEIRQRTQALIAAQYTTDPQVVQDFITRYGVTHWLWDQRHWQVGFLSGDRWVQQYQPAANQAVSFLASGQPAVVQQLSDRCTVFQSAQQQVLDAPCLLAHLNTLPGSAAVPPP
ncbi:MAG TPA: hypothetical protein V6D02_14340 [Candidatus Obscuribacterales bacterium]